MSTTNRPISDPNARHAFLLAVVLDRDHAPGFLRAITENDRAWNWWVSLDDKGRMGMAAKLLDVLIPPDDEQPSTSDVARIHSLIDEQRDVYETIITAIAARGGKTAAHVLLQLRLMRHDIKTGATH